MAEKKQIIPPGPYFWTKRVGVFNGTVKFGEEMPADLKPEMRDYLWSLNYISNEKPVSFDAEQVKQLSRAEQAIKDLQIENSELKRKLGAAKQQAIVANKLQDLASKSAALTQENKELSDKVDELEAELEDLPKNISAANKKIKELQKQLDEATAPRGK